jgi:hypothetical protein
MNQMQEDFYQVMTRLKANRSRAASSPQEPECETIMTNGLFISRPVKKITEPEQEKEPVITLLGGQHQNSKAGSIVTSNGNVNKANAIHDFIFSNGTRW